MMTEHFESHTRQIIVSIFTVWICSGRSLPMSSVCRRWEVQ